MISAAILIEFLQSCSRNHKTSTSTSSPRFRPSLCAHPSHYDLFEDRSISPYDFIEIAFITVSAVTMTATETILFLFLFLAVAQSIYT